jgi:hypothetical protein
LALLYFLLLAFGNLKPLIHEKIILLVWNLIEYAIYDFCYTKAMYVFKFNDLQVCFELVKVGNSVKLWIHIYGDGFSCVLSILFEATNQFC